MGGFSGHGIAVSHDIETLTTNCLILGVCPHRTDRLKREVKALYHCTADPTLLSVTWLEAVLETRARRARFRRSEVSGISVETGLHWTRGREDLQIDSIDFAKILKRCTILGTHIAWDEYSLSRFRNFLDKVEAFRIAYRENNDVGSRQILDTRMSNVNDMIRMAQDSSAYVKSQLNNQVQTVGSFSSPPRAIIDIIRSTI
jgi:hypothetical protein